ncbi:tetratricopeptide repeat protein [Marinicellulosiphila megalodicopiae]|uniref:tetratricopeptide repeat protein n=1 Tax=Marinicellulosiphila megalodicopiae TaxID=2724896 RepID=UPI003BAEEF7D
MNKIELYKGYLAQDPTNEILILSLAQLLHENGKFTESLSLLDNLLLDQPNHEIALSRKASVLISNGSASEAKEILQSLTNTNTISVEIKHNLAVAIFYNKEIDHAISEFEKLQEITNLEASSNKYLAACFYSKGDFEKAIDYINKAISIEPTDYLKGFESVILYTSGQIKHAIEVANSVLQTSPENLDALSVMGTYCIEQFETAKAISHFEKMRSINKNDCRAFNGLGLCLMQNGNSLEAIKNFNQAVYLSPTNLGYIAVLAWSYINTQNFDQAVSTFKQALEIENNFAEGHGGLATAYMYRSQIDLAEKHCAIAFKLDKQCFSAIYCQSVLLTLKGKMEVGQKILAKVLDQPLRPGEPSLAQMIQKQALKQQPATTNQSRLN